MMRERERERERERNKWYLLWLWVKSPKKAEFTTNDCKVEENRVIGITANKNLWLQYFSWYFFFRKNEMKDYFYEMAKWVKWVIDLNDYDFFFFFLGSLNGFVVE